MWQVTKKKPFFQFILSALKVEKVIEFMREAYRKNTVLIEVKYDHHFDGLFLRSKH